MVLAELVENSERGAGIEDLTAPASENQIDDAFGRVKAGTYGVCIDCGEEIPDERLRLVPDTPYCVKDAAREQARAS